ncbi:MAG: histidine triad nucleotide-binding protein [Deltaproteobacteria bacterium]|nr:histidine triad nucleotide-binding protein [Deltaproteobacteria bacterium]
MAEDCIFCKIVSGAIPSTKVYEDDRVLAFDDIHPLAPVHVVVIPKKHISTLLDCTEDRMDDLAAVISAVIEVAKKKGIDRKGFRTVLNCNAEGGQVIFHLHAHVLGGKKLADEMG